MDPWGILEGMSEEFRHLGRDTFFPLLQEEIFEL